MPLAALSHVTLHYAGPVILDDVTLAVEPGRKIGVIGQNGTGKSTLLKLLAREVAPTAGEVFQQKGAVVAMQRQELRFREGATVIELMRNVFADDLRRAEQLAAIEAELAADPAADVQRRLLVEYDRLQREHEAADGYDVERRIETVLSSLGLPEEAREQPVDRFSGGERNVIGLAAVLLSRPDLMLLDEPSNHLDMEGLEWFTSFVRHTEAAVVMVSHNRALLDAVAEEIWEVRGGEVTQWTGNYTAFKEQKAKALELQERMYRSQQRTIERIEFQARRLMDMANAYDDPKQAKRAKAMRKRLERMDKVDRPDRGEQRFHASLAGGPRHGQVALTVHGFSFAFDDRPLFEDAHLELDYGDRVCLVGPNGCGKTTLIRQILEHGSWENPVLRLGKSVRVGEYRQLHDVLDAGATLLSWTADETGLSTRETADLLHSFLFTFDDLERPIGTLSGGEKSRLQLLRLVHAKVNFLVLDEPTNHLDLQACEQLEEMLQDFPGTLLVISHDEYFLRKLVDRVVEVREGKLHLFRGSFDAWWESKRAARESRRRGALELRSRKSAAEDEAGADRREREERKERQRVLRQTKTLVAKLERQIERGEGRKAKLLPALQAAYAPGSDASEAQRLADELGEVETELASLYERWEKAAGALE